MLQAVTAPPSSGQWFGFPRCCSLTGQGTDSSHCTHRTGGGDIRNIYSLHEVCVWEESGENKTYEQHLLSSTFHLSLLYLFVSLFKPLDIK